MAETLTALTLDAEKAARLHQYALASGRAPREVVSEALDQYLDRQEEHAQLDKDTLASWEHYQSTGLHLTGQEVDEWLAKLEAGEIVRPPEFHT